MGSPTWKGPGCRAGGRQEPPPGETSAHSQAPSHSSGRLWETCFLEVSLKPKTFAQVEGSKPAWSAGSPSLVCRSPSPTCEPASPAGRDSHNVDVAGSQRTLQCRVCAWLASCLSRALWRGPPCVVAPSRGSESGDPRSRVSAAVPSPCHRSPLGRQTTGLRCCSGPASAQMLTEQGLSLRVRPFLPVVCHVAKRENESTVFLNLSHNSSTFSFSKNVPDNSIFSQAKFKFMQNVCMQFVY